MVRSLSLAVLLGVSWTPAFSQEAGTIAAASPVALQATELINDLHQREWVRLDTDGKVTGTLFVLSADGIREERPAAKIVISKEGKTALEIKSDEAGKFVLEGLEAGTYALQVRGDVTFAAYALHILPADSAHLTSELEVFAATIPSKRALELVNANLIPSFDAAEDVYYRDYQSDPLQADRKFNDSHRIKLRGGNLVGRVSRPGWLFNEQDLTGTVARIVRDGQVVAKASVNSDGYFTVSELQPGVYDLFVSGDDGYAALAFEAVAENALAGTADGVRFVAAQLAGVSDCLCCELVQQPEITCCEVVTETVVAIDECGTCGDDPCGCGPSPVPCGGMVGGGGFYGGGGGAGYGAGGGGALLGAAGLALGIAALTDDGDGFNQNVATIVAP